VQDKLNFFFFFSETIIWWTRGRKSTLDI